MVTTQSGFAIPSGDITAPQTGDWEGALLLDLNDIIDRHEVATLIWVEATLSAQVESSSLEPLFASIRTEISSSPSRRVVFDRAVGGSLVDDSSFDSLNFRQEQSDSVDFITRPLVAHIGNQAEDDVDGTSWGGAYDRDTTYGPPPAPPWDFDRRDNLYINGAVNIRGSESDSSLGFELMTQMVFGISEDR